MKRVRVLLAASVLATSMMFVAAPEAKANCAGEPDVCAAVCQVGLSNKYTAELFSFCYVW